jgi:ankyrin repeat protein
MLELLRTYGCETYVKDIYLQTPLYYTAREGKLAASKYLIESGDCGVNDKDFQQQTPLFYAAR